MTSEKLKYFVWGLLAGGTAYTLTAGASYICNVQRPVATGIEKKILVEKKDKKEITKTYISIPLTKGDYLYMELDKNGIGTSLEYRDSELEKELEEALKKENETAESNYKDAIKEINDNYDNMDKKTNEAKKKLGWETKAEEPIKKQVTPSEQSEDEINKNFDKVKKRLTKTLGTKK